MPRSSHHALPSDEAATVAALRQGDERVFVALVETYGPAMLRVARMYVSTRAVAEEVVQDAWLGVFSGIDRFEGRSSLKTWLFRILTNTAKTRGERESRTIPFSSVGGVDEDGGPSVDPDRFLRSEGAIGHWASPPRRFSSLPEERLVGAETIGVVAAAIAELPETQRTVITLRDVEGWTSEEVRNILDLSETNQRVILHRARAKVRRELEAYIDG